VGTNKSDGEDAVAGGTTTPAGANNDDSDINNAMSTTPLQGLFEQPAPPSTSHGNVNVNLNNNEDGLLSTSYRVAVKNNVLDSRRHNKDHHDEGHDLIYEDFSTKNKNNKSLSSILPHLNKINALRRISLHNLSTTLTGSIVFAIYHTVFCLAMSSSILRPHASPRAASSTVGSLAKLAALGVLTAGPTFVWQLGDQV